MTKPVLLLSIPAMLAIAAAMELSRPHATPTTHVAPVAPSAFEADPVHSAILFQIRHAGVSNFSGRFTDFTGTFTFDEADPTASKFEFTAQAASVDTNNEKRDDHLRNADFFNARQFPTITFAGTSLTHVEGSRYTLSGDLTLLGQTKPVTAELEWLGEGTNPYGMAIGGFEARFEIKRSDFGSTKYLADDGSESGGLGNTVRLIVAVEGVKK